MKTISFFSEKGGVGKSSFSIMYASWLHFKHGIKAAIFDFNNNRIENYRKTEAVNKKKLLAKNGLTFTPPDNIWPIYGLVGQDIYELKRDGAPIYWSWFMEKCNKEGQDIDVAILDFPGALKSQEFMQLFNRGKINFIAVPVDRDTMAIRSALLMKKIFEKTNFENYAVFVNRGNLALPNLKKGSEKLAEGLKQRNLRVFPDMISESNKMSSIDKVSIIRSTFEYPDFSNKEIYGNSGDLGTENLFIDVTRELAKTKDIEGTGTADLSFVNNLVKVDDGRQFKGSSFPEYEI